MGGGGRTSVTDVADTVRVTTVTNVMHERTKSVTGDAQSQRLSFSSTLLVIKVASTSVARFSTFPYIGTDHKVSPFVLPFTGIRPPYFITRTSYEGRELMLHY